jgi:uncharacterized membrane protein
MDSQVISFYIHLFVSILVIGIALYLRFSYPAFVNDREGFRTAMSMKNENTWVEANKYFGVLVLRFALIWCVIAFGLHFVLAQYHPALAVLISVHSLGIVFLLPQGMVETHLEKLFDKNGQRK